ncbi:hypothetical protein pqer_cds_105 [Pandoravirus quercus]|uniref:Uncharacterized protein n=1 Tax=Pandoravirus quercus TaxID=2107709 RepID=A0A2U7U7Y2_9VIRU|nr:hypothetical protein pqer_cds_105 [Pandoravirus quercus]AVK74527.1 hypothetical protein pqer_cds_105 [Pandoravirus quercus]
MMYHDDQRLLNVPERNSTEPFGRVDAAAASDFLERAWAVLRHDRDLIETGGIQDTTDLCSALCGHLGCALPGCRVRCDPAAVQQAIRHIHMLADHAWLACDVEAARARALAAVRDAIARTHCQYREGATVALVRLMVYRALRPYVDVLHDLHGRLWGVYGPFWALVARRPRILDGYQSSQRFPTPRAVEAWLAAHNPDLLADGPSWMEVDEGHGAAGLARMRAVALAKVIGRGVTYPAPGDTPWAPVRRTLALTLAADPDSRLILGLKERMCVVDGGTSLCVRTVTLYAARRACPLTADTPAKMVVARSTMAYDDPHEDGREIKANRVSPTVACLQRLGVGKYTLDAWVRAVARQSPDVLYTTALLDMDCAARLSGHNGRDMMSQTRPNMAMRRSVVLDGCTVAALVRDAYVVQAAAHNAAPRLFRATSPSSSSLSITPSRPLSRSSPSTEHAHGDFSGVPVDERAAVDADTLLGGGDVPADRIRAAVRYATWRVCRAGGRNGCDCIRLAALLERAGLTMPRSLITRLTALWG